MKHILLSVLALTVMANADYETFKSQTQQIGAPVKSEEIYFGEYTGFSAKLREGVDTGFAKALYGGVASGAAGAGIGAVVGLLDPFVMSLHADQKYLRVVKITDGKGKVAFKKVLFVGDKNPSYSDAEIRQLMGK